MYCLELLFIYRCSKTLQEHKIEHYRAVTSQVMTICIFFYLTPDDEILIQRPLVSFELGLNEESFNIHVYLLFTIL